MSIPVSRTKNLFRTFLTVIFSVAVTLAAVGLWRFLPGHGQQHGTAANNGEQQKGPDETAAPGVASPDERKILYWRAPMDPTEIYDKPGKSKMGMDLVPVYADQATGGEQVKIDPVTQQNMGVRVRLAEMAPLRKTITTYGNVTYNETKITDINSKFDGWLEKIHVAYTGQMVTAGEPLFDIYSPALVSAQEEFLVARRALGAMQGNSGDDLLASARRRLANWDVPLDQIATVERTGTVQKTLTMRSPVNGTVIVKKGEKGTAIKAGATVFRIADLGTVWVEAHIYEYEIPWITVGQKARMTLPSQPGKVYTSEVSYIYPYVATKTRDVVARLVFDNPDLQLKPEMYGDITIEVDLQREGLVIPSEAVIRTGKRDLVFIAGGEGNFTPREVTLGLSLGDGRQQVLAGLVADEAVVTSGQFLLDSESKLREAVQKMIEIKSGKQQQEEKEADDFFKDMN